MLPGVSRWILCARFGSDVVAMCVMLVIVCEWPHDLESCGYFVEYVDLDAGWSGNADFL